MKWVGVLLLWILGINSRAQSSDIVYVPDDNTLIVTYKTEIVGLYIGGKYMTSYPAPYLYTTPSAFVNRFGADISLFKDVSVLVGTQVPMYTTSWIGIQTRGVGQVSSCWDNPSEKIEVRLHHTSTNQ